MSDTKQNPDEKCKRCGWARHAHALVNYADGPFVGLSYLICHSSCFYEPEPRKKSKKSRRTR